MMRVFRRHAMLANALLTIALLLITGCASIPLSTLWQMRNFDAADLATVQPRDVRLAGLVDPVPLSIDPAHSQLELRLTPRVEGASDEYYRFDLRETQVYDPRLTPERNPRWQVFALDDASVVTWTRLQPRLMEIKQRYRAFNFKFVLHTAEDIPANSDTMIVSAKLQLGINQAPVVLLDRERQSIQNTARSP